MRVGKGRAESHTQQPGSPPPPDGSFRIVTGIVLCSSLKLSNGFPYFFGGKSRVLSSLKASQLHPTLCFHSCSSFQPHRLLFCPYFASISFGHTQKCALLVEQLKEKILFSLPDVFL